MTDDPFVIVSKEELSEINSFQMSKPEMETFLHLWMSSKHRAAEYVISLGRPISISQKRLVDLFSWAEDRYRHVTTN